MTVLNSEYRNNIICGKIVGGIIKKGKTKYWEEYEKIIIDGIIQKIGAF